MILVTIVESLNLILHCVQLFIDKKTSYPCEQNVTEGCNIFYYVKEISKA